MADDPNLRAASKPAWQPKQLVVMCAMCLATGFLAGYLLRGSASAPAQALSTAAQSTSGPSAQPMETRGQLLTPQQKPKEMPSLDELQHMADKKAAPLLKKLQSDPKNPQLWNQIGLIYKSAHQFKEASGYFEKSLQYDPKNLGVRAV